MKPEKYMLGGKLQLKALNPETNDIEIVEFEVPSLPPTMFRWARTMFDLLENLRRLEPDGMAPINTKADDIVQNASYMAIRSLVVFDDQLAAGRHMIEATAALERLIGASFRLPVAEDQSDMPLGL
jgi:hypothetical protein